MYQNDDITVKDMAIRSVLIAWVLGSCIEDFNVIFNRYLDYIEST